MPGRHVEFEHVLGPGAAGSRVGAFARAFARAFVRCRPAVARGTTAATIAALVALVALAGGVVAAVVTGAAPARAAVTAADETVDVVGHGYGHGRGMSQWGARGAADAGASLTRILGFYYPGTRYGALPGGPGTMRVVLTNAGAEGVAAAGDPRRFQCDAAAADPRENCGFAVLPTPGIAVRDVLAGTRAEPLPRTVYGKPVRLWGIGVAGARGLRLYADVGEGGWRPVGPERSGHLEVADLKTGSVQMSHRDATVRDYRGAIRVIRTWGTSATTIARINLVGLDDYLRGVVPREMPAGWPATALSAQAVAARSYAASVRDAATAAHAPWDLCDSTACQVYGGRGVRYADGRGARLENTRTDAAIRATAGRVVLYRGRAAYAQFSAANGGWSARGSLAYQRAAPDRWDADGGRNPHTTWRARVPVAAWQALLPAGSRLTRVVVTQREGTPAEWGGRVLRARLEGTAAGGGAVSREVTGEDLRRTWAGVGKLRSSWFRILPAADPHDQLAALATAPGSADLASRGGGGHLLVRPWSAGTGLGAITDLGGVVLGAPAIAGAGPTREVFARGGDGKLWWKLRSGAGPGWSGWVALGRRLAGRPAASARPGGRTLVVVPGVDGALWRRERSGTGRWSGWRRLGVPPGAGPALVAAGERVQLVVRGVDGGLWGKAGVGDRWGGWVRLGGAVLGDAALASDGAGRATAVVRGSDRRGYARDLAGGGPRGGWSHLGGVLASAPVAVQAAGSERVDVLANGVDGELLVATRAGGAWSRWAATG